MIATKFFPTCLVAICALAACAPQSTPSMMNTNKPQVLSETTMQQVAVKDVKEGYLRALAEDYTRFGSGNLHLSLVYDPASKNYSAMKAFNDLADIKARLNKMGVRSITAETIQAAGDPTLMINYDALKAAAPKGCTVLPGADNNQTTRHIGDYKFGCTIDTMVANQIYRPEDLRGNNQLDPGDGRRAANSTEHYRVVTEAEANRAIDVLTRDQIQSR